MACSGNANGLDLFASADAQAVRPLYISRYIVMIRLKIPIILVLLALLMPIASFANTKKGRLVVISKPSSGKVSINGARAPMSQCLAVGRYRVSVMFPGYGVISRFVEIQEGKLTTFKAILRGESTISITEDNLGCP